MLTPWKAEAQHGPSGTAGPGTGIQAEGMANPWPETRPRRLARRLLGACAVLALPAAAQSHGQPQDVWERLEARGARFSGVDIRIGDVFDPARPHENHWIGRLANAIHLETRRSVIAREIPFRPGDPVSARLVHQVERNLRAFRFIKDAFIDAEVEPDGRVKAVVRTQDAWTLKVSAGFTQVGGQRNFGFSLKETNFLGFGKDLALSHEKTTERSVDTLLYRDRQFLGTDWNFATRYQALSDGKTRLLEWVRPYRGLETPWSMTFRLASSDALLTTYNLRRTAFEAPTRLDTGFFEGTWARAPKGDRVLRVGGGLDFRSPREGQTRIVDPEAFADGPLAPPDLSNRQLLGMHLTWSLYTDRFRDFQDLAGMTHTEDYNLGWEATLRLGTYTRALGGEADTPFFGLEASKGWLPGPDALLLLRTSAEGRREPGGWRNLVTSTSFTAYSKALPSQTLAANLLVDTALRPDPENFLYLGGTEGLRGYANHLFVGDRRWILSVEERPITPINWLGILQLGFVVYADAGAIRRMDTGRWSRTYANVGGGLRFGDLKSSLGRVFLITVAWPLVRDPGMERSQLAIGNVIRF